MKRKKQYTQWFYDGWPGSVPVWGQNNAGPVRYTYAGLPRKR